MYSVRVLVSLVLSGSLLSFAAEKPSPFVARTSAPAVAPAAPVSPVVPISMLRSLRPKPVMANNGANNGAPGSTPTVSPVSRGNRSEAGSRSSSEKVAGETLPPPPVVPTTAVRQLKATVLTVPAQAAVAASVDEVRPPQVNEIAKGASRSDVLAKLGNPATVISMYDDGRFTESLRYERQGKWLGTVRMIDGRVARVDQP